MMDVRAIIVANTVEVGDCLEWTGPYGCGKRNKATPIIRTRRDGKARNLIVHREAWKAAKGPIPEGKIIYRSCCNYRCVGEQHLACGPRGVPLRLRGKLGLAGHCQSTVVAIALGRRRNSRYTSEQIGSVRAMLAEGLTCAETARMTGVGADTVEDVKRGRAWATTAAAGSVWAWRTAA